VKFKFFIFYFWFMFNKDLILLWIQWCGKWTQSKLLIKKLSNHLYYEMWETLRLFHKEDNLIWNYMKDCMNRWEMVDNFISNWLAETAIKIAARQGKNIMIDWYPRVQEQVDFVLEKMKEYNRDFNVIHYSLSEEEAIKRLLKRAEIEWRKDDNLESIKTRIWIFINETLVQIKRFEEMWKVITINADNTVEWTFQETCEKLWI